ncbi:hypothetical protein B0T21DRAFT_160650 [Apiosordaria backusii]|uniref:Uncharacterized protein n=1 Tax=Apiosordaria backusii TaxID=314023 RepID=A0AA40EDB6_9PEZI|nr:hypothetical protein B0T21DRAFT_160650 [Apiosordaria backusii]
MASEPVYEAPTGGFRALNAISDAYTKVLRVAYPATRDIAKEVSNRTSDIVEKARQRVSDLVFVVQELKWEIEEARRTIVETNETLHRLLTENDGTEDPLQWDKEEEVKPITEKPVKRPPPA